MTTTPPTGALENAMADAAAMAAALRQAQAAAAAPTDAPTTPMTFGELTNFVKLLTALGLFTADQAIALLKALEHGEGITQLPDLTSPEGMVLYNAIKSYIAAKFGPVDVNPEQIIEGVIHVLQQVGPVLHAVADVADAIGSFLHGLFS